MGVARHLSGVARHLSGVARHLSGVARHLSGQALIKSLHLSHTDGQHRWTATGHLIVPALSQRRACRREPLNVVNVTSLTDIIAISCICISTCKWCV